MKIEFRHADAVCSRSDRLLHIDRAFVAEYGPRRDSPDGVEPDFREHPQFWSVYVRGADMLATHIADCVDEASAVNVMTHVGFTRWLGTPAAQSMIASRAWEILAAYMLPFAEQAAESDATR